MIESAQWADSMKNHNIEALKNCKPIISFLGYLDTTKYNLKLLLIQMYTY